MLIVFNSHFDIANVRQGYVIRKANKLNFSSSFRSIGQRAPIWTYILTLSLEGLIIIAGIIATAILAVILGSIGYAVSKIASYANYNLFIIIFAAPSAVILVLYLLISLLIFSPTAYIITNNVNISAGETIGTCYRSMINNGKMTVFLTYFVSTLLRLIYWAALVVGGYFVFTLYVPDKYFVISIIGCSIVSFVGYLMFAPILTLTNRVVKEHLFEDIVLDPAVAARVNEKINLSVCDGKKIKEVTNQNLASLFDYTEDPYKILDVTEKKSHIFDVGTPKPAGKKVKEKIKNKKKSSEQEIESEEVDEESVVESPEEVISDIQPKIGEQSNPEQPTTELQDGLEQSAQPADQPTVEELDKSDEK